MAQETLFRILSRQPWWVTLLVALAIFGIAQAVLASFRIAQAMFYAFFTALPFVVLTGYIAYKQFRGGVPANAGERLTALRAMSWEDFSSTVTAAYRRQGYEVTPSDGAGYDFKLSKGDRITLLQCRRWKVNQVGAAPVRELADAVDRSEASRGICLAAGEFSAPAQKIAAQEPVSLISGTDLVELVGSEPKKRWRFVR